MTFLDKKAFIVTVRDFDADNDIAALAHAYTLRGTHTINVTQADRRVGEVGKAAQPVPPWPRLLRRVFAGAKRGTAATVALPQLPVLSPTEVAARNYARMQRAAMAHQRRMIDKW